jgi:hypothetical protein
MSHRILFYNSFLWHTVSYRRIAHALELGIARMA